MKFRKKPVVINAMQGTGSNWVKFRKKPIVINAMQWTGSNWDDIAPFVNDTVKLFNRSQLLINTLESHGNPLIANPTDWIIKGVVGEYYPCQADIFSATYEEVK